MAEKVNRHVEQRKFDTNLKIHKEKRKEDEKKKKREAQVQNLLIQRIIAANQRKLDKALYKPEPKKFDEKVAVVMYSRNEVMMMPKSRSVGQIKT